MSHASVSSSSRDAAKRTLLRADAAVAPVARGRLRAVSVVRGHTDTDARRLQSRVAASPWLQEPHRGRPQHAGSEQCVAHWVNQCVRLSLGDASRTQLAVKQVLQPTRAGRARASYSLSQTFAYGRLRLLTLAATRALWQALCVKFVCVSRARCVRDHAACKLLLAP